MCLLLLAGLVIASLSGIVSAETNPAIAQHAADGVEGHHGSNLGERLALWWIIPFAGILLSIALFPLFAPAWWHHNFPKVAAFWAILFAGPFLFAYQGDAFYEILHIYLIDYIPFIILLWSLYTVAGGILVRGTLQGSPVVNTVILLVGTVMASWIGTTGASMILIRPLLRANSWRRHKVHLVIFFIFLVSNIGGSLTPLGDPPLFLGFLHSVPFFWTLNLFPAGSFLVIPLMVLFFFLDSFYYRREEKAEAPKEAEPLRVVGLRNFFFLAGIVGAVLGSGLWHAGTFNLLGVEMKSAFVIRDIVMVGLGLISLRMTPDGIHKDNEFTWFPIKEVAILFAGIFMTIIPALLILKAGEHGVLASLIRLTDTPAEYFWITGGLVELSRQRPDLSHVLQLRAGRHVPRTLRTRGRFQADRRERDIPARDFLRSRFHGCRYLHWQRAQLHGEEHCRGDGCRHAELLRLPVEVGHPVTHAVLCYRYSDILCLGR